MELHLDDIQRQRNANYGFNNTCVVLKAKELATQNIILIQSVKMSYFTPSGKARLGTKTSYCVYIQCKNNGTKGGWFHLTRKADANKYFKQAIKEGS